MGGRLSCWAGYVDTAKGSSGGSEPQAHSPWICLQVYASLGVMSESQHEPNAVNLAASAPNKPWWKSTAGAVIGVIGLVASSSSVYALVDGWLNPAPSLNEVLDAVNDDSHQVNQVSKRVDELGDQYRRIATQMKDLKRLDASLKTLDKPTKIQTAAQKKRANAMRKKETEEFVTLLEKAEAMAQRFVSSAGNDTNLKDLTPGSKTASIRARTDAQIKKVRNNVLPQLEKWRLSHAP